MLADVYNDAVTMEQSSSLSQVKQSHHVTYSHTKPCTPTFPAALSLTAQRYHNQSPLMNGDTKYSSFKKTTTKKPQSVAGLYSRILCSHKKEQRVLIYYYVDES